MPLEPGMRLGPYEVLTPLGAGGMGEVYRARDARLGRDVAIKVVPTAVAEDADALGRFEREARAVAALSHPNILTLYDVGRSDPSASAGRAVTFAVMELLEGETLRSRLTAGGLPQRKAVEIAAQVARGLAAAHDKHIAHRDLKPENIFITSDGSVKVLDFGLARQTGPPSQVVTPPDSATIAPPTEPGVVLGTVGYMSPEQVRGEPSDHRADIFSLGCVLYEMLTGRRAYHHDTAAETMTAILKEDPPDPSISGVAVTPALLRTIRRCLEKRPEERFQSTRDLAFALESALDISSGSGAAALPALRRRAWSWGTALLALGLVLGATMGWLTTRRSPATQAAAGAPTFRQLTFERGTIRDAQFTPDGQSVIYGAAWEGNPLRVFMTRTDAPASVRLSLPDARLMSIARTGEMAVSFGHTYEGWMGTGTLARTSVLGSAPRVLAERVREAAWTPDGSELAVARRVGPLEHLEFPLGTVLYRTSGFVSDLRFSPDGELIAFADHPLFADDAGGVSAVDRAGKRTILADGFTSVRGLAWSPDGREVWFTGRKASAHGDNGVYAVTLSGQLRMVWSSPSFVKLFDIAADGRVLLGNEVSDRRVEALMAGATGPVDVSLRASSTSQWISDDGSMLTIADQAAPKYTSYLIRAGGQAMLLGDGQAFGVSRDGRWVVALPVAGAPVLLHPVGAGKTRELPNPQKLVFDAAAWLPDGRHLVMFGQPQGQPSRGYVQDTNGGAPRAFTPEGVGIGTIRWWTIPVSPDGTRIIGRDLEDRVTIFRVDGGAPSAIPGLTPDDVPVQWTEDGKAIFVARGAGLPWIIERLDLATGRRTPALQIRVRDGSGLRLSTFAMSPNGRHYVHSFSRLLTELFVVEGLR